ncbi:MAG TPA: 3-phosphoshikimate 1-carboxyvinyltransferase [Polyangia bacterium]|jgi:3-phosphoshikimate 1-carboxyvinyltransferase|nr:3-phosphoshikimate 1-carboxyvinyltransferase [Polyangia bacterium]
MSEQAHAGEILSVERSGPLRGTCRVPGDKSVSHRALLFGALTDGAVEIAGLGLGGDNVSTARALQALGVAIDLAGEQARVTGVGLRGLRSAARAIDCGNSGTSIRLLTGLVAGRPFETVLEGDSSLTRRPMRRLAEPLRLMGAIVDGRVEPQRPNDIFPPLRIRGGALHGIRYPLPVASAQLKSALVLAGLQAKGPTIITEPAQSRDHTERMLRFLGAPVSADPATNTITVEPDGWDGRLRAIPITVPGDFSSATFLLVAALIVPGSDVVIENVGINPTRTGALDVLRAMGGDLTVTQTGQAMGEPVARIHARASHLRGVRVDGTLALRSIDEIPALTVAAAVAEGTTVFADLEELRVKESDRIRALARELGRAGVAVTEQRDGLSITGTDAGDSLRGGTVIPEGDHRIAMSAAILGLCGAETTLVEAKEIATSFPTFAATLRALGATL